MRLLDMSTSNKGCVTSFKPESVSHDLSTTSMLSHEARNPNPVSIIIFLC